MTDQQAALAVDWGGTWCRAALIDRQGEIRWQARRPNPPIEGGMGTSADYLSLAAGLLDDALRQANGADGGPRAIVGIGIAVAGPVDPDTGILYQPPNLMPLDGLSPKRIWQERYGLPVVAGNDANLAALGEFRFGAGRAGIHSDETQAVRPPKSLFYVTVSTGIGGGLVTVNPHTGEGALLLGANGLTAEVGHTTVDTAADAPRCQCGKRGCLEAISSGTAIANYARAALYTPHTGAEQDAIPPTEGKQNEIPSPSGGGLGWGRSPHESSLTALAPQEITARAVVDAAAQGDAFANAVMARAVEGLAVGLANAVHLFNPDLIILGGGVSDGLAQLNLFPRIRQGIHDRLMSELHKAFHLAPAALGDNSGLMGAAAAVWETSG